MGKIVLALGGNALIEPNEKPTKATQLKHLKKLKKTISKIKKRNKLIITHGNGPQVGYLLLKKIPLHLAVEITQKEIGKLIEKVYPSTTIITHVLIDKKDKAFKKPTKPIGPYYKNKGKNRIKTKYGYRKVVASPKPKKIMEINEIKKLIKRGGTVICCGGGGIPIDKKGKKIAAVIDKDYTTGLLAKKIKAEKIIFLTNTDYVYLNYNKKNQKPIKKMTIKQAEKYLKQNQFPEGSMKPKIKTAINFIKSGGKEVIIAPVNMKTKTVIK